MSKGSATASAFALALTCAGCGSWSGFGFDAASTCRRRGISEPPLALAREAGSSGRVFSTEIDPARLAGADVGQHHPFLQRQLALVAPRRESTS